VNSAARGRGGYRGRGGGRGAGGRGDADSSSGTKPVCQLCKKTVHIVTRCWKRFDRNFTGEKATNNAEGPGYNVDTAWYSDTGVTDHVTSELDKLVVREKYTGQEQIHAANGGGMQITHVGHSILYTPSRNLSLKNVLRVPSSQRNLVFIHCFTHNNHVFVEYHPYFFLVKDPYTRKVLLHSRCRGGLYSFPSLEQSTTKCVLSTIKPSINRWHERLSHPSRVIVQSLR
jgi:hypothetical protein